MERALGDRALGSDPPEGARRDGYAHLWGPDAPPQPAATPSLEEIERRRRRLWLVSGFFLLVASAVVALALTESAASEAVPDLPGLQWGLFALAAAFLLYAFDQERLLRRFTRAFVEHDVRAATLETRVADLTTLTRITRLVNSALTVGEVTETVLDATSELTRARNGSVLLCDGQQLRVTASRGPEAAPPGERVAADEGLAGEAVVDRRPVLVTGTLPADRRVGAARAFGSAVIAPLVAEERVVGVLSLERAREDEAFTELDLRSIALFADHAGIAVANAQRYEGEHHTATRLAEVLELRSEFLAALVHDMKNPITAILGYTNLVAERWETLEPEHRLRAFEAVTEESQRLLEMVEGVLHSASVDAGAPLRPEPVSVTELVRPLLDSVAASAQSREGMPRQMRYAVQPGDGPARVAGDEQALRHVLLNLLDNAVKYSPPGAPVDVCVATRAGEVVVEVTDHGEGIAAEEQAHVFERFRRASGGAGPGVGLGLYIARTLVTAHGGRLTVASAPGEGSTFRVTLPAWSS